MTTQLSILFGVLAIAALPAQESLWTGNSGGEDVCRVTPSGRLVRNMQALHGRVRKVVMAPDQKVWVRDFDNQFLTIYDANGNYLSDIVAPNTLDIAFDRSGDAWVLRGGRLDRYTANGVFVSQVTFPFSGAGISIDTNDNKWIAGSGNGHALIRVDTSGVVNTFPLPAGADWPNDCVADIRGTAPLLSSHIWITGQNGHVYEFDDSGSFRGSTLVEQSGNLTGLALSPSGSVWIGSSDTGSLYECVSNGSNPPTVITTLPAPPEVNEMAFDGFGKLWVGTPTESTAELRRIDLATGNMEVATWVGAMFFSYITVSSNHHYALVTDPHGDLDSDGDTNADELRGTHGAPTSPFDSQSNRHASLSIDGNTTLNGLAELHVSGTSSVTTVLIAAGPTPMVAPGLGVQLPGIAGEFVLNLPNLLPGVSIAFSGAGTLAIPISSSPAFLGLEFAFQGVGVSAQPRFTNVAGAYVWPTP